MRLLSSAEIYAYLHQSARVLNREALVEGLGLRHVPELAALDRALEELIARGQILVNRRGGYAVAERADLREGVVIGHPDGYGFVRFATAADAAREEDWYLPPVQMRAVLHGDRVLAALAGSDFRGRTQGLVAHVLSRRPATLVGRYVEDAGFGRIVPDDRRIHLDFLVPAGQQGTAAPGDVVVAQVMSWPEPNRLPTARIERVLGREIGPMQAIDAAIAAFAVPDAFPPEVLAAAAGFGEAVRPEDLAGREDLRGLPLVTIDGEDARDFDDAVWCQALKGGGYRLVVAIADVSHYVRPGYPLDSEALNRGTSVYFPNRVLPMLPEGLSNGLCSLKPAVDRLCMVADLRISAEGETTRTKFYRAVMHSHARLTYQEVWTALNSNFAEASERARARRIELSTLYALYQLLAASRVKRGALDFEGQEVRFGFDASGSIAEVRRYERNDAHKLIEECMIAANVAAARFLHRGKVPALYRVHAPPPLDRYGMVAEALTEFGVVLPARELLTPLDLERILMRARERPEGPLIEAMLLRMQSLAVYSPANSGHFGLALQAYAHFTSPIRRYPDLLVHRAIGHLLDGGKPGAYVHSKAQMEDLGRMTSMCERRADEATREVAERLKCAWLAEHLGASFDAIVTGITGFGAFVELAENRISGLIHVTQLPNDYYHYEPGRQMLIGERTGGGLRLADRVRVKVIRVDPVERKIDFALLGTLPKVSRGASLAGRPSPRRESHGLRQ